MNTEQITQTNKLIDQISFKFSKIKQTKKYLDIVFVFGSAEPQIRVSKNTNKVVDCIVKFIPQLTRIIHKKDKLYYSQRKQFLEFTDGQSNFKFVTIEKLYDDLKIYGTNLKGISAKRTNLVDLELKAIEQAYSLIIFPESVGSYAELGYFTALQHTKKKMYVANHYEFNGQESYLNHLIDEIHNSRTLRPASLDFYSDDISNTKKQFQNIVNNLQKMYSEDMYEKYEKTNKLLALSILFDLLTMFPRLSFTFLYEKTNDILKSVIKTDTYTKDDFSAIISLLVVVDYIKRINVEDKIYLEITNENSNFLVFDDFDESELVTIESVKLTYKGMFGNE